ncbi:hypothetical protein ACRRTK_024622 [Alexandromys fortis]
MPLATMLSTRPRPESVPSRPSSRRAAAFQPLPPAVPLGLDAEAHSPPQDREGQLRRRGDAETLGYRPQATGGTAAILLCCAGCREEPLGMGGACPVHAPEELAGGAGWLFPPLVPPAGAELRVRSWRAGCAQPSGHPVCEASNAAVREAGHSCPRVLNRGTSDGGVHTIRIWDGGRLPRSTPSCTRLFRRQIGNLSSRTWLRERTAWAPAAISLRFREPYEPENGPHVSTEELKQEVFAET